MRHWTCGACGSEGRTPAGETLAHRCEKPVDLAAELRREASETSLVPIGNPDRDGGALVLPDWQAAMFNEAVRSFDRV